MFRTDSIITGFCKSPELIKTHQMMQVELSCKQHNITHQLSNEMQADTLAATLHLSDPVNADINENFVLKSQSYC